MAAWLAVAAAACTALGLAWWRLPADSAPGAGSVQRTENLLWAATLALTLVVNSYTPIYDSILAVAAVVLAAEALPGPGAQEREALTWWMLLLYMAAWVTQSFAEYLHLQLFTLALAGFGGWMLRLVYQSATMTSCSRYPAGEKSSRFVAGKLLAGQGNLRLGRLKTGR